MSFKACVFDLDGTLCDSVESMADCANHTMRDFGLREATIQDYKVFVGDGVDMLITVEGTGLVSESGRYTLNRVYELGVNSSRTFCTKYAEFIGTVTEIF